MTAYINKTIQSAVLSIACLLSSALSYAEVTSLASDLKKADLIELQERLLVAGYPPRGTAGNISANTISAASLYMKDKGFGFKSLSPLLDKMREVQGADLNAVKKRKKQLEERIQTIKTLEKKVVALEIELKNLRSNQTTLVKKEVKDHTYDVLWVFLLWAGPLLLGLLWSMWIYTVRSKITFKSRIKELEKKHGANISNLSKKYKSQVVSIEELVDAKISEAKENIKSEEKDANNRIKQELESEIENLNSHAQALAIGQASNASAKVFSYITEALWVTLDNNDLAKLDKHTDQNLLTKEIETATKTLLSRLSFDFLKKDYSLMYDPFSRALVVSNLLFYIAYGNRVTEPLSDVELGEVKRHCSKVEAALSEVETELAKIENSKISDENRKLIKSDSMVIPQVRLSVLYVKYRLDLLNKAAVKTQVIQMAENASESEIADIKRDFKGIDWDGCFS